MTDVKVAVGLGGEACRNRRVLTARNIIVDDLLNKVTRSLGHGFWK